uniref:Calponin-homology (CH) domain-containing protein n=1 Tax=Anopheles farauti TaxID=69004 RepID=A0A182QS01_9DIPT
MSAFEVTCTPPRVVARKTNENREPTLVLLGPFTPKATVVFDGVPVGKSARRLLIIRNTNKAVVQVTLSRLPDPVCGISFEWTTVDVEAGEDISLEVVWSPMHLLKAKEVIIITDSIGNRKDVQFILKTADAKLATTKKPVGKSFAVPKKLKLKSPSPPKVNLKRNVLPKKTKNSPAKKGWSVPTLTINGRMGSMTSKVTTTILGASNSDNNCNRGGMPDTNDYSSSVLDRTNKENVNPTSPQISGAQCAVKNHLTSSSINESYTTRLASLATPECLLKLTRKELVDDSVRKNLILSPTTDSISNLNARNAQSIRAHVSHDDREKQDNLVTPQQRTRFDPTTSSTVTKTTAIDKTYLKPYTGSPTTGRQQHLVDDQVHRHLTFSPEHQQTTEEHAIVHNKTHTVTNDSSTCLSIITEENAPELGVTFDRLQDRRNGSVSDVAELLSTHANQKTFTVASDKSLRSGSLESIAKNVTITIKSNVSACSLTNLLDKSNSSGGNKNALEVDEVDKIFKEHEIRAQSSRFNLHEVGRYSDEMMVQPSSCKRSIESVGDGKEAKLMVFEHEISPPKRRCRLTSSHSTCSSSQQTSKEDVSDCRSSFRKPLGFKPPQTRTVPMMSRSLNLKRTALPLGISAKSDEKRVFLYDPDRHLINPDPFAATTTCNPFLSATMYLDERAFAQYERQMKKWLNALVTIPADLDTELSKPLDVGKLFDEVKSKELTLAPTKELISCKYYKNRLNSLRSAGIALYMSEEIAVPLRKVATQIEKQLLTLRTDRTLHLDLSLQRTILELLLCFNPLWLRLGLEVVYGEQIELHSNRDIVGLSTFIIHRLFRDRYLEARNSRAYNLSNAYAEHMRKFTLRMVLFLLLFLDTAKRRKLIKHNPCLFVRNAPYKETREILARFASNLVAGIGDITKHLKRVGYTLSHKQSFLDEYHYAFENLAVDLRDGVRLTRVMEIILLREDLSASLRVPPISRLQKIHNINLALGALEQADYRIAGDITAKDICDGHREQTMSLLWQIVYKFRAPKFNAAAIVLQRWWRNSWLHVVINRRVEEKRRLRREAAARTIQAAVRGYCVRVWYEAYRAQQLRTIITIQRFVRRYLAQKLAARRFGAIVRIQQWWRSVREMRLARERYLLCKKSALVLQTSYRRFVLARKLHAAARIIEAIRAEAKHRHQQATIIQRSIKSYVLHRRLQAIVHGMIAFNRRKALQYRSAAKIQSFWRMITTRRVFRRVRWAAFCIQRRWRECMEAKRMRNQFVLMRCSAIILQRHARGWIQMRLDRQRYEQTRASIVQLQHRWRAILAMRKGRSSYVTLRRVTINVQRRFRAQLTMVQEVQRYRTLRKATLSLQRRYRANRAMTEQRQQYSQLRVAAICLQRRFRAQLRMRAARAAYASVRCAIVTIQVYYRATLQMRAERNRFLALRRSTVTVQSRYRAILAGRVEKERYESTRRTIIAVQRKWRAQLEMRRVRAQYRKERSAAIVLQRVWRAIVLKRKIRSDYLRYRAAATVLQQRYRALVQGRAVRREVERRRCAAVTIQRQLRASLQMKHKRGEYVQMRQAVLTLQRRFRAKRDGTHQRSQYLQIKRSAITLSNRWAATLAMRQERVSFLRLKSAAIVMQRQYRARKAMQDAVQRYERIRSAVLFIQHKYRAQRAMEKCRGRFLNLRSASIVVQEFYRGYRLTKHDRSAFLRLRAAVVSVQRRFRGKLLARQATNEYEQKKKAAVLLQRWFRGHQAMVAERTRFATLKRASTIIQQHYRARCRMIQEKLKFARIRRSVTIIQNRWRATLLMRQERAEYQRVLAATRTIQTHYRAYRKRLVDESSYRIYRSAVIVVQRRFREKLSTRYERHRFEAIRRTVYGLQTYARGHLARRAFRAMLTPEYFERKKREKAARRIQAWWRGAYHRKRFQTAVMRKIAQKMVISRREARRDPTNRLSNVCRLCLRFLQSRFSSSEAIGILQRLERMSRLVPHLLVNDAVFLAVFCYNTMAQAIRSEVDKILIEICARIILNLARFGGTKEQAFQEDGLVTVSQMLLRWCDKDCGIFSTLCTLLWVLAHDIKKKNAIRRYMITKDAVYMLRETKKLVQRKEKMKKNVQRPVGCLVAPNPQLMRTEPSLDPDFGVNRSKPYVFYSNVFAFERILSMLEVDLS